MHTESPAAPPSPRARRPIADPIRFLETLARQGDIAPFRIGRRQAFLVSHPADIEDVLVTHAGAFARGPALERAEHLLGTGLLTAEGTLHRSRRRLMAPAFHRARIERLVGSIVRCAVAERDRWRAGTPLDVADRMGALALRIAGLSLFGEDPAPWAAEVRGAFAAATASADPLISLLAPLRRVHPERRRLDAVVDGLIARRQAVRGGPGERPDDLLALLLEADVGESPSRQLRDDVLTMLLAAHDTIANALTWTWSQLAGHPHADRRLADELAAVLGDRLPAASDLPHLPFTRGVLAEALRICPPAWVLVRAARRPHRLGSIRIPAGSLVVMSPHVVHRDPRFFDEPLAFEPGRWMPNARVPARPKLAYFPFGAGPRACIGESFAWMEGVLVLATCAQRWRMTAMQPPAASAVRITQRPCGPVMMMPAPRPAAAGRA
ncbi:MAG: cytochrome P450 [Acidobacteria bacterium]|nr:cytochrome P450 [Acidobacteriota bacterium]